MPSISIIIPNYNTEKYLPRCLDSLITQTMQDIEIIIIDDGSTDNSVKILRQYAEHDKRIKIIEQKNSGPATARNAGLDASTGKYLMFCDSDDWYDKNMCQIMFDTIEKKNTDIVCCHNFFDLEDDLDDIEKKRVVEWYYNNQKMHGRHKLRPKIIPQINTLLWNKIWRRDLVKKYNIRFPDGHEFDDNAFLHTYACVAKSIFFIKKPLYHYFLRRGSIMSTQYNKKPKNRYDSIIVMDYTLNFLVQNNLVKKHKVTMCNIFLYGLKYLQEHPFFTCEELCGICWEMNKKIRNILKMDAFLVVYGDQDAILLQNKSYFRLFFESVIGRITLKLCSKKDTKKLYEYWYRYTKNKLEWKYKRDMKKKLAGQL